MPGAARPKYGGGSARLARRRRSTGTVAPRWCRCWPASRGRRRASRGRRGAVQRVPESGDRPDGVRDDDVHQPVVRLRIGASCAPPPIDVRGRGRPSGSGCRRRTELRSSSTRRRQPGDRAPAISEPTGTQPYRCAVSTSARPGRLRAMPTCTALTTMPPSSSMSSSRGRADIDNDSRRRHRVERDAADRPGRCRCRAGSADRAGLGQHAVPSQRRDHRVQRSVSAAGDDAPVTAPAEHVRGLGGTVRGTDLEVAGRAEDGERPVETGAAALPGGSIRHGQERGHSTMMTTADEWRALGFVTMPAVVLVGAQWGDEGKGKATDLVGGEVDYVVRYNAATRRAHDRRRRRDLCAAPAADRHLTPGVVPVMGNGVVVDLACCSRRSTSSRAAASIPAARRAPTRT